MSVKKLNSKLGNIDIYLLDQVLKSRFNKSMKILDAGCGEGRNLVYFISEGYQTYGIDENQVAIKYLKTMASSLVKDYPIQNFVTGDLRKIEFDDAFFDVIISSAVLHFSHDDNDFRQMFAELMRVLTPGGILFVRMCCDTGLNYLPSLGDGIYRLPDGSSRYLLTSNILASLEEHYKFEYLEPYKSVVVHDERSMSVLIIKK